MRCKLVVIAIVCLLATYGCEKVDRALDAADKAKNLAEDVEKKARSIGSDVEQKVKETKEKALSSLPPNARKLMETGENSGQADRKEKDKKEKTSEKDD